MTLKEMRALRAAQAARGRAATIEFNTLGAKADRDAAEDTRLATLSAELDALDTQCADLDAKITAEETAARRSALFSSTTLTATAPGRAPARTLNEPDPVRTGGFRSLGDFANAVIQSTMGNIDTRLGATTATGFHQNQGTAGEGFLVPPQYSDTVWEMAFNPTDLLGMSMPEPTSSNAVIKPKDETTPWGAAGVQAYWGAEASLLATSKAQLTGEMMQLHKLYAFVAATDEILSDAPMLQSRLTTKAGQAISWRASEAIMRGTGVGQPLGLMNSAALITVPKTSGQAAQTLTLVNIANMIARVLRIGGKPMWLANTDILPQLITMQNGQFPAYMPTNQSIQGNPFDGNLLGYPIMFSEHSNTLGTAGDLVCLNMAGYYSVAKGGIEFASSIHLYFDQGLQAFRWTFRLAGQPYLSTPVAPAFGTNTKSHFVALATRA